MEQQIFPTKQLDGSVYERHVYSGPQGDGYIDRFFTEDKAGEFLISEIHVGPEERDIKPSAQPVKEAAMNVKLLRLKEGKAEWKQGSGFEIKAEFKEEFKDDGSVKIKEVEPIDPVDPKDGEIKNASDKNA